MPGAGGLGQGRVRAAAALEGASPACSQGPRERGRDGGKQHAASLNSPFHVSGVGLLGWGGLMNVPLRSRVPLGTILPLCPPHVSSCHPCGSRSLSLRTCVFASCSSCDGVEASALSHQCLAKDLSSCRRKLSFHACCPRRGGAWCSLPPRPWRGLRWKQGLQVVDNSDL